MYLQKGKALTMGRDGKPRSLNSSWIATEKHDGERALWDGGVSRGIVAVPWRHRAKRTDMDARGQVLASTGLWSNNGNPIYAPNWWLDLLPKGILLDGELWAGYGNWQTVHSIVSRLPQNNDMGIDGPWSRIQFRVFDAPTCDEMFCTRHISTPTCKMLIDNRKCAELWAESGMRWIGGHRTYEESLIVLRDNLPEDSVIQPWVVRDIDVETVAEAIKEKGGEGLIVRDPTRFWHPQRVPWVIKIKPRLDADGIVVGYTSGRGRHQGRMGSMIVRSESEVVFSISGFTDKERETTDPTWCSANPGFEMPEQIGCPNLPDRGSNIVFKYRELSRDGVPKEAVYHRKRRSL